MAFIVAQDPGRSILLGVSSYFYPGEGAKTDPINDPPHLAGCAKPYPNNDPPQLTASHSWLAGQIQGDYMVTQGNDGHHGSNRKFHINSNHSNHADNHSGQPSASPSCAMNKYNDNISKEDVVGQ